MHPSSRMRRWVSLVILFVGLALATSLSAFSWLMADLPSLDDPSCPLGQGTCDFSASPSSKVYDRHGRLLFEMPPPHAGRHTPVALDEVPLALRQAVIATEDASFYENPGVDGWAILRAVWINLRGGEVISGGSTITQQLARNLLLDPEQRFERTLARKLRETVLAWRLTQRYSKDDILALYLNEIYFGNMAYGVEAAAQAYFGKHVSDLDLAECAMLAGLPQAPALYNPLEDLSAAKQRQAVVLDLMVGQNYLTGHEAKLAKEEKLSFAAAPIEIHAPHFVMYVRRLLEQQVGLVWLEKGGLQIYTTIDLDLNETARDLVRNHLTRLGECQAAKVGGRWETDCPPGGHNVRNAALVALNPDSGEILAMLGSPDYFSARIDGAVNGTTALRQPGSAIKPITYATAFETRALTPATMMLDVRTAFVTREGTPYVPLNYDLQFRGPVLAREALASSYNLIAVKVLERVGVEAMTDQARRLGITTFDDPAVAKPGRLGLAVTLGGGEVRLLELTAAYAAFANGGHAVQPVAILRVEDPGGQVLWAPNQGVEKHVLEERVAYLISDILSDNVARTPSFGEGSVLELSHPAAVKTGTTTDFRDNWTIGYTASGPAVSPAGLVVGVWVGNADNEPMRDVSGISGAAPVWHDFMEAALQGRQPHAFDRPEGLVAVEVCALSGMLPGPDCAHRVTDLFVEGTEPSETCTIHQRIALDRNTGLRATDSTPPDGIVERVYPDLPPEAKEWAREHAIPQPPPLAWQGAAGGGQQGRVARAAGALLLKMSSPDAGAVYRLDPSLPRDAQRILVSAQPGGTELAAVTLFVDGQPLAKFDAPPYRVLWRLEPGEHLFSVNGTSLNDEPVPGDQVRVTVKDW